MNYLNDLQQLKSSGIYTIEKIEFWLLKYSNSYKSIHNFIYSQHLSNLEDGSTVRLPPFTKVSKEEIFIDLYDALVTISGFHRNEKYFKQEMLAYQKIKNSFSNLRFWTAKNENLGAEKYACFLIDYLDYAEDEKVEHLSVFVPSLNEFDIYIDRQDFTHTIDFLKTFNELYWCKKYDLK